MTRKELANLLLTERRKRHLTLRQVATSTGVSIGSLSQIERGNRNLTYETALALLQLYGLNLVVDKDGDPPCA